jgi:hypothetical protein
MYGLAVAVKRCYGASDSGQVSEQADVLQATAASKLMFAELFQGWY